MTDSVRTLTPSGVAEFQAFLSGCREGSTLAVPQHLLADNRTSGVFETVVTVEKRGFPNRFAFGQYLATRFAAADRRTISRNAGLWTWLALYYFDELCPVLPANGRKVLSDEAYVLPQKYDFRGYYRHLVRTPWLTTLDHGDFAKVLLIPTGASSGEAAPLNTRGEIMEQLGSRQSVIGNPRIIEAAYRLYFNESSGLPARGTGGSGGGSPRRLALVLQQFDLTFDLGACEPKKLIELLPSEFDRWKRRAA